MGNKFFSFTQRDYENSRKEGLSKIPSLTGNQWTDLNASDPGVVLIDYLHSLIDMCNYYLDHQAMESFLSTAKERDNLIRLSRSLDYSIRSSKGSKVDIIATVDPGSMLAEGETITIPRGTIIPSLLGINFMTKETVVLSIEGDAYTVPCTQGEYITESYIGTGVSRRTSLAEDSYAESQIYRLKGSHPDSSTVIVRDSTGYVYEQVPYVVLSGEGQKSYSVEVDSTGAVSLHFGDGVNGYIPQTSDTLSVSYVNTEGSKGAVDSYGIKVDVAYGSSLGNNHMVHLYNDQPSSGGSDGETDEELRYNAISHRKTLGRAVTAEDFRDLALQVDGVSSAVVHTVYNSPDLCDHHEVRVVVSPEDPSSLNSSLVSEVYEYLHSRMIPPTNLYVQTPSLNPLDVVIHYKKVSTLREGTISEEIEDLVKSYVESLEVGENFVMNDLIPRLYSITGLKSITLATPASAEIPPLSIASLGTLTVREV